MTFFKPVEREKASAPGSDFLSLNGWTSFPFSGFGPQKAAYLD